ncbi:MAG: sigma-70 family RNA polymerase sigma factor [Treponema sp.]|jgi:RNA polymerase sigma-70 factor (ECF subfamily)|nr:sigma-70 family RNA polymerase sigma factor [Treponema sp.]
MGDENGDELLIIAQIIGGEKELFRLLVARYERAVFGMGLSFFRNREDALDYSQEVFLKVYNNLSRFEGRARFSTWLYRIAYNTAVNGVERRREYRSLAEDAPAPPGDTPERTVIRNAARAAVLEAIDGLPERYRICLDLFFFYDRSFREIEEITGFPVGTIKSHVFRAKKALREKLAAFADIE